MAIIDFSESVVTVNDPANRIIVGRDTSKTIKLALFTLKENAAWAAEKILATEAYPLTRLTLIVNRDAFKGQPGDCAKVTLPKYGWTNKVFRIDTIAEQSLEDSETLEIVLIEDIDYIGQTMTSAHQAGREETTITTISGLEHVDVIESPYIISKDEMEIIPLGAKNAKDNLGYMVYLSTDGGTSYKKIGYSTVYNPYGTLVNDYTDDTYNIDDTVGFRINFDCSTTEIDKLETITRSRLFTTDNVALLEDEIISFQTITPVSGTLYDFSGIVRGRFDSEQVSHSAGSGFWFLGRLYYTTIRNADLLVGGSYKIKLVPYNLKLISDISEATAIDVAIEGRSREPYRPINLEANDKGINATYTDDIILTWRSRMRYGGPGAGQGLADVIVDETPDEYEGLFKIEVVVASSVVRTTTGINTLTWTYTEDMSIDDNGSLPINVEFNLYNYRYHEGYTYTSVATTISVLKE